jgi:hypothetical protein
MADENLQEMRCRTCGTFMGYRTRIGRFIFWCSEDCAGCPMAKWKESQIRDEVIVELFLEGNGIMEISRLLNGWPYQYVQQTLARRGLQDFMEQHFTVQEHTRIDSNGQEHTMPARRMLVREKAS